MRADATPSGGFAASSLAPPSASPISPLKEAGETGGLFVPAFDQTLQAGMKRKRHPGFVVRSEMLVPIVIGYAIPYLIHLQSF